MKSNRGFIVMAIIYAVAIAGIIGATWYFLEGRCNSACKKASAERDQLLAEKDAAIAREAALERRWSEQVKESTAATQAKLEESYASFATLKDRARRLPSDRIIRLAPDTARLFDDAVRAANAGAPAKPSASNQGGAAAVPESATSTSVVYAESEFREWLTKAAEAYSICRVKHLACVSFYEELQRKEIVDQLH